MLARDLRGVSRSVVVPVDAGRLPGLGHDRQDVPAADRRPGPHRHSLWSRAPASDCRRRAVAVEAADNGHVGVEQFADFGGDGLEDFSGLGVTGDERRDPPERGLLFGKLGERLV